MHAHHLKLRLSLLAHDVKPGPLAHRLDAKDALVAGRNTPDNRVGDVVHMNRVRAQRLGRLAERAVRAEWHPEVQPVMQPGGEGERERRERRYRTHVRVVHEAWGQLCSRCHAGHVSCTHLA